MNQRHTLAFLGVTLLTLSACGSGDSGDSALNPASDVELVFSTFTIERRQDLEASLFWDFYRGIEPADGNDADASAWAQALRDHVDAFMGSQPASEGLGYSRLRNPYDLMAQVIAAGEVANFRDARQYISERIDLGVAGTFNSRSNDASIRFIDQGATEQGLPLPAREWVYPLLAWVYAPAGENSSDKVIRTVQYIARAAEEGVSAGVPELQSLLVGTQFGSASFGTLGYNPPELVEASFTGRTLGRMSLSQDFIAELTDTLFISETDAITVNGQSPDCVRAELDYPMATLVIFTSRDEPAQIPDASTADPDDSRDNPAYCANKTDATTSFATQPVPGRQ
ncbi:MAG: hypothetical protein R3280_06835 [Marinobacter sp.]|uniref:hypothetical protein n=1 Tax=Marinobacter sp. TaxID=50741 RepID=UPI00299CEE7B|nr:hypothetical protein [Marinobacter sp.]MDX1634331.1 hypothetical protein [Marinobacter sp.]